MRDAKVAGRPCWAFSVGMITDIMRVIYGVFLFWTREMREDKEVVGGAEKMGRDTAC